MSEKQKVRDFLGENGLIAAEINFSANVDKFIEEMNKGLAGEGSLQMLPTYLSLDDRVALNEPVIVIDAGGTNFRVALVHFDQDGQMVVDDFQKHRMPGTSGEIGKEQFFEEMAALVRPVAGKSERIGFCFSYPIEIQKDKDGKILYFTKELKVKNAEGELVGKSLLDALGQRKKLVVLNDTVAALLGGVAAYPKRRFSSYMGFILGTGTNTAYIEKNKNIIKNAGISGMEGSMIVNMESGNYNQGPRGEIDNRLDANTKDPGRQQFEKMISGAYQGRVVLTALKKAIEDGLFSDSFADKIMPLDTLDSYQLDAFLFYPYGNEILAQACKTETDRQRVYYIIEGVIDRAAKLSAINLAAGVKKTGAGQNPLEPVCILVEGTTYYKSKFLKERILAYLNQYMNQEMGLYADLLRAEDVTLLGSGIAGSLG